jgi:hypothetical protein
MAHDRPQAQPTSAAIQATLTLERVTEALRLGRCLSATCASEGVPVTAGLLPSLPGAGTRYAVIAGEGATGRMTVLSSARSAAARYIDRVGPSAAAASLSQADQLSPS